MARLAPVAAAHLCRRVRCGSAPCADVTCVDESFRFLLAHQTHTFRDRATELRFTLASGFFPTRESETMDCRITESVPVSSFCPVHVSPRDSDHCRFVPNVFRIYRIQR